MWPAAIGRDAQVGAIGRDRHAAVEVRAVDLCAMLLETFQRRRRRVAVAVVPADADDRDARQQCVEQCVSRGGAAAVMGDLEDVDRGVQMARQAAAQQLRIDLFLGVAGEEHGAGPEVELEHDRDVVDRLAVTAGLAWHAARQRPVDE